MVHKDVKVRGGSWASMISTITIGLALLVVAFLSGHVASSLRTVRLEEENGRLEQRLILTQLLGYLGMASYEAQRNNYACADEYSTEFFNRLGKEIGAVRAAALRQALETISHRRDEITTDLTAANPAVKEKIAGMYAELFNVIGPWPRFTPPNVSCDPGEGGLPPSGI